MLFGTEELPPFAAGTINLASAGLGARALTATDEFFAPLARMIADKLPEFDPDLYDDNGKYMDGWESRRKRVPGHDRGVVKLAMPGRIVGFDIDTHFFTGNYPPFASIDAAFSPDGDPDPEDDAAWTEILPKSPLGPSAHHFFENADRDRVWTHIRLHIYPDGGVARLRVYGAAHFDWTKVGANEEIDLGYIFHGAKALAWSDAHYGHPDKMLGPGRGINMGSGWETKRRRGPGHDWAIIRLGHPGRLSRIVVDTHFYKGNFPDTCEIRGAYLPGHADNFDTAEIAASESWQTVLPPAKLRMDHIHEFSGSELTDIGPVTHIRYAMHPDGGTMRLRLFGTKR
jgi:allantoicase